ncbi:MAG: N-acetylmuramoyl-L-alanine amidase [Zoogloeaceae bacterium]|nr:N-acetylmuramoyl-L-alanine amidase [Zoogloeaceae bacterium]
MSCRHLLIAGASFLLVACTTPTTQFAGLPRLGSAAAEWSPVVNFDLRRANFVILHHTSNNNLEKAWATLSSPVSGVSSHYLIGRDGRVLQLVDENLRAWHAGASRWGGQSDMNSASIGIELDNDGMEPFPEAQIEALLALLRELQARHRFPAANVLGHADVAPTRKSDPSALFPWVRLAAAGFGLWCDAPAPAPPGFDAVLALAALGYDTRVPDAALAAFRRHFLPDAQGEEALTQQDAGMVYCLLRQQERTGREEKN